VLGPIDFPHGNSLEYLLNHEVFLLKLFIIYYGMTNSKYILGPSRKFSNQHSCHRLHTTGYTTWQNEWLCKQEFIIYTRQNNVTRSWKTVTSNTFVISWYQINGIGYFITLRGLQQAINPVIVVKDLLKIFVNL